MITNLLMVPMVVVIGVFFLWLLLPWMIFQGWFDDPADGFRDATDAELIATFHAHRPEIERLRVMWQENRRVRTLGTDNIGPWWRHGGAWHESERDLTVANRASVLADMSLTPERDAEYQKLMRAIGSYRLVDHAFDDVGYDLEVCLTRRGNVVRGISKSFVFTTQAAPPPPLTPRPNDPDREYFTPLADGWYLRYIDQ